MGVTSEEAGPLLSILYGKENVWQRKKRSEREIDMIHPGSGLFLFSHRKFRRISYEKKASGRMYTPHKGRQQSPQADFVLKMCEMNK